MTTKRKISSAELTRKRFVLDTHDCNDNSLNAYYAGLHEISDGEFNNMIKERFGTTNPTHKKILRTALDLTKDCNEFCIGYTGDFYSATNTDINVGVVAMKPNNRYSIQLFKGIIQLFNPDTFYFSKGIDSYGNNAIIFRAVKSGTNVYYGDLTSTFPFWD
jgi:hypothetical protein